MLKNFNRENIEVGTTLFLVPAHLKTAKPQLITINKVGRKFAYFGVRGKIDLDTLSVVSEGSGTPTLWDSEADYQSYQQQLAVIAECRDAFCSHELAKRKKLTYEKAVKILAILNDEE